MCVAVGQAVDVTVNATAKHPIPKTLCEWSLVMFKVLDNVDQIAGSLMYEVGERCYFDECSSPVLRLVTRRISAYVLRSILLLKGSLIPPIYAATST